MPSPALTTLDRQRLHRAVWRPALIAAVPLAIVWGMYVYSLAFPSHGRTTPDPSETAATWGIAVVVSLLVIPIALFRIVTILRLARTGLPVLGRPLVISSIHKMGKVPVTFGYVVDGKVYVRATDVSGDIAASYTAATRVLIVYHPGDPWIWHLLDAAHQGTRAANPRGLREDPLLRQLPKHANPHYPHRPAILAGALIAGITLALGGVRYFEDNPGAAHSGAAVSCAAAVVILLDMLLQRFWSPRRRPLHRLTAHWIMLILSAGIGWALVFLTN
ncbi:MAG: hypothetical protein ACHRHE_20065 [Tepidisphaerales bacterium]